MFNMACNLHFLVQVDIEINGEPVDIHMKLGETGEAFFVEELEDGEEVSQLLGTSPLPPSVLQEKLERTKAEDEESKLEDSGVDESVSSSSNLPKSSVKDDAASNETIVPGDEETSESTLQSDTLESEEVTAPPSTDDKPKNEISEIGVIQRVRKREGKREQRDCQTQTEGTISLLNEVPKKADLALLKGSSIRSLNSEVSSFNGFKHNSVLAEGQESKTDGEETVKCKCMSEVFK